MVATAGWMVAHVLPEHEDKLAGILQASGIPVWLPKVKRKFRIRHVNYERFVPLLACYVGFCGDGAEEIVADSECLWDGGILHEARQDELISNMALIDKLVAADPDLMLRDRLRIGQTYRIARGPFQGKLCRIDEKFVAKDGVALAVVEIGSRGGAGVFANVAVSAEIPQDALEAE